MQIKATREVKNSIVSTTLTIDAFGSDTLTASEEKEILEDYKLSIDYGKVLFSRYVELDEHKNPHVVTIETSEEEPTTEIPTTDEPTGDDTDPTTDEPTTEPTEEATEQKVDLVTLAMPMEVYDIDENMALKYAVDISKMRQRLDNYKYIEDYACLAKAMICVFEAVVTDYIKEQLDISRKHKDEFEDTYTYEV